MLTFLLVNRDHSDELMSFFILLMLLLIFTRFLSLNFIIIVCRNIFLSSLVFISFSFQFLLFVRMRYFILLFILFLVLFLVLSLVFLFQYLILIDGRSRKCSWQRYVFGNVHFLEKIWACDASILKLPFQLLFVLQLQV